jgi:hypothetical protein
VLTKASFNVKGARPRSCLWKREKAHCRQAYHLAPHDRELMTKDGDLDVLLLRSLTNSKEIE